MNPVNYRMINREVMIDTQDQCETNPQIRAKVLDSIQRQYMVSHEDTITLSEIEPKDNNYKVTSQRALDVAEPYARLGKKVAVLNFASNHSIGGAPFSAGAQEESICRCSTLYPCLKAKREDFYVKHIKQYEKGIINYMGNDDLIYTPDVCVFKKEKRRQDGAIYPTMMQDSDWFNVDIITCAAPELWYGNPTPRDYEDQIRSRVDKIIRVAQKENVDVLVLGAWGCGAFKNPADTMARIMRECLEHYSFETVVFAMGSDITSSPFTREFAGK